MTEEEREALDDLAHNLDLLSPARTPTDAEKAEVLERLRERAP